MSNQQTTVVNPRLIFEINPNADVKVKIELGNGDDPEFSAYMIGLLMAKLHSGDLAPLNLFTVQQLRKAKHMREIVDIILSVFDENYIGSKPAVHPLYFSKRNPV